MPFKGLKDPDDTFEIDLCNFQIKIFFIYKGIKTKLK